MGIRTANKRARKEADKDATGQIHADIQQLKTKNDVVSYSC